MSDDLRTSLAIGARLLAGWACVAVGVLDLSMGIDTAPGTTDGSYLLFHLVLVAGGLLLLGLGRLRKTPTRFGYGVTTALAVLASAVTALPSTRIVCCLLDFDVRHGYPLTLVAWNRGQPRHFAPAHAVADLIFWMLAGVLLLVLVTQLRPEPRPPAGAEGQPTHAEERATAEPTPVADDENVGGLP